MKKKANNSKTMDLMLDYAHPHEWKEVLWLWYSTTVTGSYLKETSRKERTEMKLAYEFLHQFFDEIEKNNK